MAMAMLILQQVSRVHRQSLSGNNLMSHGTGQDFQVNMHKIRDGNLKSRCGNLAVSLVSEDVIPEVGEDVIPEAFFYIF
jgi:hypothetical protein